MSSNFFELLVCFSLQVHYQQSSSEDIASYEHKIIQQQMSTETDIDDVQIHETSNKLPEFSNQRAQQDSLSASIENQTQMSPLQSSDHTLSSGTDGSYPSNTNQSSQNPELSYPSVDLSTLSYPSVPYGRRNNSSFSQEPRGSSSSFFEEMQTVEDATFCSPNMKRDDGENLQLV